MSERSPSMNTEDTVWAAPDPGTRVEGTFFEETGEDRLKPMVSDPEGFWADDTTTHPEQKSNLELAREQLKKVDWKDSEGNSLDVDNMSPGDIHAETSNMNEKHTYEARKKRLLDAGVNADEINDTTINSLMDNHAKWVGADAEGRYWIGGSLGISKEQADALRSEGYQILDADKEGKYNEAKYGFVIWSGKTNHGRLKQFYNEGSLSPIQEELRKFKGSSVDPNVIEATGRVVKGLKVN
jgi:hypothetical protein